VTTRFPVDESLRAYRLKQIARSDITVIVNPPVTANFEKQRRAYTFDLPYLFRVSGPNDNPLYALSPRTASDNYATDASNRWECKAVNTDDVTYQFLICRTSLLLKPGQRRCQRQSPLRRFGVFDFERRPGSFRFSEPHIQINRIPRGLAEFEQPDDIPSDWSRRAVNSEMFAPWA
jgi:hypothetical protein